MSRIKTILLAIWRWVGSKELLTYLSFVVVAAVLWTGHAWTSVRNLRVPVHISYTGVADNIGFSEPPADVVWIEVRDAGRRLIKYRTDPPNITYDLSSQLKKDKGEVHISEEVLRRSISDMLQGTSKLQQISPEEISGKYYTQHSRKVKVVFNGDVAADREYIFTSAPRLSQEQVTIYGSREHIREVDSIETEFYEAKGLRDSTQIPLRLIAPEGIRLGTDSVTLMAIAERWTEKIFTLPVHISGSTDEETIRLFPHEVKVTARVSMAHFNEVGASAFHVRCPYPKAGQNALPVKVDYKSDYVYGVRVTPSVLEFIIEQNNE